jgi:hypothetical protein
LMEWPRLLFVTNKIIDVMRCFFSLSLILFKVRCLILVISPG